MTTAPPITEERKVAELADLGPAMVPSLCSPFPNLAEVAWVFHDLGRASEPTEKVLAGSPVRSPWGDAARAILRDEFVHAADLIASTGNAASTAHARLRAAEVLSAKGHDAEASRQRASAEAFVQNAGAIVCRDAKGLAGVRAPSS